MSFYSLLAKAFNTSSANSQEIKNSCDLSPAPVAIGITGCGSGTRFKFARGNMDLNTGARIENNRIVLFQLGVPTVQN